MEHIDIAPIRHAEGSVILPGSKSISNRTLLLAALADNVTEILGLLDADDTRVMLTALRMLGTRIEHLDSIADLRVHGTAGRFPVKEEQLFLGNAGTAFRPLTAALALMDGTYRLDGVARMRERPIGDLVDALLPLGADISYTGQTGYPPLTIRPRHEVSGPLRTQVRGDVSSQFLSGLLMAAPLIARDLPVRIEILGNLISKPYVEITLNLMHRFGVNVQREGWEVFTIPAGQNYHGPEQSYRVEGDASSASYFLALGALAGGPVRVNGVGRGSIQGDVRFTEVLRQMGVRVELNDHWIAVRGVSVNEGGRLNAIDADFNDIPDAAMTVAVMALFADGPCRLNNIGSWRVKETDRIEAMASELRKLGATVVEGDDYLVITPPEKTRAATIDTYDDHRMAMCFSLAACGGDRVRINDPGCVAKTFPTYFDEFIRLAQH